MAATPILILGCGYTGKRVARTLAEAGYEVTATARDPRSLAGLDVTAVRLDVGEPSSIEGLRALVTPETGVLYSLPSIGDQDWTPIILDRIRAARRIVYLSTTGVYGAQRDVNETTEPGPHTSRERLRVQAEMAIMGAKKNALILRPAAIYGPHRGIHAAMRAGTYRLSGEGTNFVSRIHVDDLAAHCVAGLLSGVTGAWPVADEEPCTSGEIAAFCAKLLGISMPERVETQALSETRRADRRVDGRAIRRELGIQLRYPSYRVGIPGCIEAETGERAF